ncbi:MAG: hypothetical protein P8Y77_03650 [Nitrospirota bacterium]|jgi:ribosomal protein L37AE/L43A
MTQAENSSRNEEILCPLCGRELGESERVEGGWECRCGEFIPEGAAFSPFEGCTHGRNCNCGRARPPAKR